MLMIHAKLLHSSLVYFVTWIANRARRRELTRMQVHDSSSQVRKPLTPHDQHQYRKHIQKPSFLARNTCIQTRAHAHTQVRAPGTLSANQVKQQHFLHLHTPGVGSQPLLDAMVVCFRWRRINQYVPSTQFVLVFALAHVGSCTAK
jgi:hypothetical protein